MHATLSDLFTLKDLEALFKQYQPALLRFAYKYLSNGEDAQEVVQDVFVAIWRNRERLEKSGNLKSYLFTATRNRCLNFLQKRKLEVLSFDGMTELQQRSVEASSHVDLEEEIEAAELSAQISGAIEQLPKKCRQIFILSRKEGLSYNEIAEKLGISVKTVENQIGIALKKMRQMIFKNR